MVHFTADKPLQVNHYVHVMYSTEKANKCESTSRNTHHYTVQEVTAANYLLFRNFPIGHSWQVETRHGLQLHMKLQSLLHMLCPLIVNVHGFEICKEHQYIILPSFQLMDTSCPNSWQGLETLLFTRLWQDIPTIICNNFSRDCFQISKSESDVSVMININIQPIS